MSKNIKVEINSLISELKIEVHQCDCCKHSDEYPQLSEKLTNLLSESMKGAILNVIDTSSETVDSGCQHNESQKEHH